MTDRAVHSAQPIVFSVKTYTWVFPFALSKYISFTRQMWLMCEKGMVPERLDDSLSQLRSHLHQSRLGLLIG